MELAALGLFATALFFAAASPGPGITAIVASVLGRGARSAWIFSAGVALGDVVWLTFAIAGLAVLAQTFHDVFTVVKWAGVAYLLYLAWQMWTAPATVARFAADSRRDQPSALFVAGLALTMGNPKTMVFYLALLPTLLDLASITLLGYAELVVVTVLVLAVVFAGYIALASRARQMLASPQAMRRLNRGSAGAMAGAAAWVASR